MEERKFQLTNLRPDIDINDLRIVSLLFNLDMLHYGNFHMILPVSTHVFPSPEYCELHTQAYDPWVLVHTALMLQLCELVEHSSISKKV